MDKRIKDFALTDMVTWNKEIYPDLVGSMIEKYGEGPFMVVALRLHSPKVRSTFPVAITIELDNDDRQEFAGQWFVKI